MLENYDGGVWRDVSVINEDVWITYEICVELNEDTWDLKLNGTWYRGLDTRKTVDSIQEFRFFGAGNAPYATLWYDYFFSGKYMYPEPGSGSWGAEESAPVAGSAPTMGAFTIDEWDGIALYTGLGQDYAIFTFTAEDLDGASEITLVEIRFLVGGTTWHTFSYDPTEEGNMPQWSPWTKETGDFWQVNINYWPLGNDGEGDARVSGTSWEVDIKITIFSDTYESTNIEMYGRVTDGSQNSGWELLSGPTWHILEEAGEDTGSDSGGPGVGPGPAPGDTPPGDEPGDPYWWTDPDVLDDMSDEDLELLADSLGVDYLEGDTRADIIAGILDKAEEEGFTPFAGCGLDEEAKLASLEYLRGLTIEELRAECQSLGISYRLWRDPEPYIILIFTVGYQCSPPDEFYDQGYFDPEDWDADGVQNWDDPDMFDENRMGLGARVDDIDLSASVPWVQTNGWALIILLLFVGFLYSQVKKRDKPGSRGESLIRPRKGTYSPGERSR
jgi:hypothetical protein